MANDLKKKMTQLIRHLEAKGWEIRQTRRGGHYLAIGPDNAMVPLSHSPSDWRNYLNAVSQLRRLGVDIPHKGQEWR